MTVLKQSKIDEHRYLRGPEADSMQNLSHGHRFQLFSRKDFVNMLYENAPWRFERILTNKEILSIEQDDNGVKVSCGDGTSYQGDVLIGADGVRSQVRRQLFNEDKETMPFTAEFKAVYGIGPTPSGLRVGDIVTTHGHGDSALAFVGETETYWFVFVKRDGPTQRWSRYTKEEEAELLNKYADIPLTSSGSVRVRDLHKTAKYTKLVDLEEGIIPRWYQGRVALLGDAVHKMTPYVALGINTGIESAVVLTNELRKLGDDTSTEAIALAFESYQKQRYDRAKLCLTTSGNSCRMMAWPSWIVELVSRYLMPWLGAPLVARALAPIMKDSSVLDLVEEKNYKSGALPWKFPRVEPASKEYSKAG